MPYTSSPTPTPNPRSSAEDRQEDYSTDDTEVCNSSQDAVTGIGRDGAQRTSQDIDKELFGDCDDETESVDSELFGDFGSQSPDGRAVVRFKLPSTPPLLSPSSSSWSSSSSSSSSSASCASAIEDGKDFVFVALKRQFYSIPYDPFTELISAHKHEATANTFAARFFKSQHPDVLGSAATDGESFKRTINMCVGGDAFCREVTTVEKLPLRRARRDGEWVGPDDDHVFFIWVETAELRRFKVSRRIAAAFLTLESANEVAEQMFRRTVGDEIFADWVDGSFVGIKRYTNSPDTHSLLPGSEEVIHRVTVQILDMSAAGRCRALEPIAEL